jgi:plastocyanin
MARPYSPTVSTSRSTRLLAAVAVVALAFGGCGDDGDASPAPTDAASAGTTEAVDDVAGASVPANGEVVEVLTLDNNFRPEELEITAGTTVRWDNGGRNDHNIVPVDDTQDWGVDIADFEPGEVYEHVFVTPGTYAYYCTLHGTATAGMIGTVVVTG